jgi:hypothetical protein
MIRRLWFVALLLLPVAAGAQNTTRDRIDRAVALFNNFQVEQARTILQDIISPNYLQPVSPQERVEVYKFLGASLALLSHQDTARTFFTAALDFDPFTDLDANQFGPQELQAFNEAKQSIFKVGVGTIRHKLIVPRLDTSLYAFRIVTTNRGRLNVQIISQADSNRREVLFDDENDGLRLVRWNGVLRSGQFADTGIYLIRATGQKDGRTPSTAQQFFRIEHHFDPLEDSIPPFQAEQLLQDRIAPRAPYGDLAKGIFAAAGAFGLGSLMMDQNVAGWQTQAVGASAVGLLAGTWSFMYRRTNRTIGPNAAENARRQAERARYNAGVETRNRAKLEARWIIITPLVGFSR